MKIKYIGIPKYLYYNKYKEFIKNYFEYLGYSIVISSKYNNKNVNSRRCSIYHTYLEQINDLKDKCDLVVIAHISNNKSTETNCPILENNHTIIRTITKNILTFNLKYPATIIKSTLRINKNIPKIIVSYILARIDYNNKIKKQINRQKELLINVRKKILIVTHEYYKEEIKIFINKEYDILYSEWLEETIALDYYYNYPKKTNIYFIKLMLGSIYYYGYIVNKIIVIDYHNCKYKITNYLKYLPKKIQSKITIIKK